MSSRQPVSTTKVDPITSEQTAKKDSRPFGTVEAYLLAATLRGIMTIKEEEKKKPVITYGKLKEDVQKQKKLKGNLSSVQCQIIIRKYKDDEEEDE